MIIGMEKSGKTLKTVMLENADVYYTVDYTRIC